MKNYLRLVASVFLVITLMGSLILQVFVPGFPKESLLLISGINFGIFGGTLINWIGMVLAAQVGYEVVNYSIRVGGRFSTILENYKETRFVSYLQDHGNLGLFFVRLIPYAPNDVLSLVSGALYLPRKGFVLVSIITALPYAFIFAYFGHIGAELVGTQFIWQINLVLFSISVIAVLVYHYIIVPRQTESES